MQKARECSWIHSPHFYGVPNRYWSPFVAGLQSWLRQRLDLKELKVCPGSPHQGVGLHLRCVSDEQERGEVVFPGVGKCGENTLSGCSSLFKKKSRSDHFFPAKLGHRNEKFSVEYELILDSTPEMNLNIF